ncbi:3TM-type holin [Marinobacter orientalis]|uniref:Holin of 3TMs, for gene-transfer release n=1 Tax=Marinobacter orientalis TaxID=1928859 RepID=A0A7Y0REY5_9GAMM|nr:3TM-type holin [Marinobacter orientalis]NMT64978.1 hypothetical protein [Marinobacter orientalis]TGX48130.1 hypothetical protein DIT72_16040 [Marinobacter orientalis]
MAWWSAIGDIFRGGKEVVEVFKPNATEKEQHRHNEVMADLDRDKAVMGQFAAEFVDRKNRTWWDSLIDGLNRSVRPIITFGVLAFFIIAPLSPEKFLLIAESYSLMPTGYWALLSVIIGFYFGGRMQLKSQDMAVRKDAVQAAKNLVVMRKEFRQLDEQNDSKESKIFEAAVAEQGTRPSNKVVAEWLAMKKPVND